MISDLQLCRPEMAGILDYDDECLFDEQNLTLPGPLSNKMHKEDLIQFIQWKSQECLLHVDEPESYFFWNIMELFCKRNGNVMMSEVAAVLFRNYRCLRKKLRNVQKIGDWCLPLASLLCAVMPKDKHIKSLTDLGDNLAAKGLTYPAHLCYVVAYQEPSFDLIGCESLPDGISAVRDAIERTEVYEYVLGMTSGFALPNFQKFKFLYASMLFESGLSAQALNYCETIARAVATFPDRIPDTLLDQLICVSEKLHEGKEEEAEWLLNLRLLHKKEAALSNSCTEKEQHTETPPSPELPSTPENYGSRARENRAFLLLTEEVTSQYIIGDLLGHGGGGVVYEGVRKSDDTKVAVKFSFNDYSTRNGSTPIDPHIIPTEVKLMDMVSKPFSCPYVVELLQWFEIPDYIVLILERPSPSMELPDFCKLQGGKLPEPLARNIMLQLVHAARHCCDHGVFHNDIKTGNILINTETLQIKLIDFGCGDLLNDTPYMYCPGTPQYHPPEWYNHKLYVGRSTTIWTLGIVLFEMVCGDLPFQTKEEITTGRLHFPPGLSKDCCTLISWCLEKEPKSRPSFRQIFRHRWCMAGQSYIEGFPIIGWLVKYLIKLNDYYIK